MLWMKEQSHAIIGPPRSLVQLFLEKSFLGRPHCPFSNQPTLPEAAAPARPRPLWTKGPWLLPGSNPLVGEDPVNSEVRKTCDALCLSSPGLTRKEAMGAGTGGGEVAALIRCRKGGEEKHFSLDKLFAYQLFAFGKKKNIFLVPSVPRAGPVWGLGLPAAQAARPSFRIRDSCPLDYLGKHPAFEAFPGTPRLFAHPARACQLLLGPGRLPVQPTINTPLPTSAAASSRVRFPRAEEREKGCEGEGWQAEWSGGSLPHLLSLLCGNHSLHPPPGTRPHRCPPRPRAHPASILSPRLSPLRCE